MDTHPIFTWDVWKWKYLSYWTLHIQKGKTVESEIAYALYSELRHLNADKIVFCVL